MRFDAGSDFWLNLWLTSRKHETDKERTTPQANADKIVARIYSSVKTLEPGPKLIWLTFGSMVIVGGQA